MPNLRSRQEQSILSELAAGSVRGLPLETVTDLQQLLRDVLKERGWTKTVFARTLGISLERLLKVLKEPKDSFGVRNLLRLAEVSGRPASPMLRAANKADIAELIERLYGQDRATLLSATERELLAVWNTLTPSAQANWLALLTAQRSDDASQNTRVLSRDSAEEPLPASAQSGVTRRNRRSGTKRVGETLGIDAQATPLPETPHSINRRELTRVERLTRSLEHTEGMARGSGTAGKHPAAPRAKKTAGRHRARPDRE